MAASAGGEGRRHRLRVAPGIPPLLLVVVVGRRCGGGGGLVLVVAGVCLCPPMLPSLVVASEAFSSSPVASEAFSSSPVASEAFSSCLGRGDGGAVGTADDAGAGAGGSRHRCCRVVVVRS